MCKIQDCPKPTKARGMCNMHYLRQWKYGDVDTVHKVGAKPQEKPAYNALHKRINYTLGPAKKQQCCSCGEQARDWAYDYADPNELIGTNGKEEMPYSTDPAHYQPMCRACHIVFDRSFLNG